MRTYVILFILGILLCATGCSGKPKPGECWESYSGLFQVKIVNEGRHSYQIRQITSYGRYYQNTEIVAHSTYFDHQIDCPEDFQ